MKVGNRVATPLYLDPEAKTLLQYLSEETRVPMQVYLREAVNDLLVKHRMYRIFADGYKAELKVKRAAKRAELKANKAAAASRGRKR